jgi:anthranilate phosphoribosyltransferase
MLKATIAQLVDLRALEPEQMRSTLDAIFDGQATGAQLGAFLVALRMKGETPRELAAAARVMRERATRVRVPVGRPVLDTCGTGGDGANTLNISTAVAFVAAAAGATVAKHGNRSVSSRCGSADVLEALGVNLSADVETVERCIDELGIGFLFAPGLHGVMKHVAAARREVGVRSIFNLLGPLANPAAATRQLLGVYDRALVSTVAQTLAQLGCERALVVHGEGGLDEVSPWGETWAAWVEGGKVTELTLTPEAAGVRRSTLEDLRGGSPTENAQRLEQVLGGGPDPASEAVVLNAGAALWVAGLGDSLAAGAALARQVLGTGTPLEKLRALAQMTSAAKVAS